MSQDFVNDLPTELLHQVFEYLKDYDRATAANVCKRWFDILSSERYLETLCLNYQRLETQFDDAKRYQSISITSCPDNDEICTLQRFLCDKEVMSNLKEVYIDLRQVEWFDPFEYETEECYFPNLQKLAFGNCDMDFFRIPCPQWLHRKLNVPIPKWILSDKIEILEIIHTPLLVLPKAELFPNLRSLTLIDIDHIKYEDSVKLITCRLKELKIVSSDNLSIEKIIHNARDLESLSISGDLPISAKAYEAINDMKKLKRLTLTIPITGKATGLSLPFLEKLKVFADRLNPLENVPNLRSLRITDTNTYRNEDIICKKTDTYYRLFGQQLHHLSLKYLCLDKDYISQICTLSNLQSLKVTRSVLEISDVENICQSIGKLKLLRLEFCTIVREIITCAKNSDSSCECKRCMDIFNPHGPEAYETCKEMITRFSNLRKLYMDRAIGTTYCKFIQQAMSKCSI